MDYRAKIDQISAIAKSSTTPLPLLLDLMRLKQSSYVADCRGLRFELLGGCFEWFTLLENVIREDYFCHGVDARAGDTIIDIGANFGSFTALASRKAGPSGRVIAFEPNPEIFARLQRNVVMNGLANVDAFNAAVCGSDGETELHLHRRNAFTTIVSNVDQRHNDETQSVRVRTLSLPSIIAELRSDVGLLKIDCEGAEYDILDNLDVATASRIRQITMEAHEIEGRQMSDLPRRLRDLGFRVVETFPMLTAFRARN